VGRERMHKSTETSSVQKKKVMGKADNRKNEDNVRNVGESVI
jgi:hypothetical protein